MSLLQLGILCLLTGGIFSVLWYLKRRSLFAALGVATAAPLLLGLGYVVVLAGGVVQALQVGTVGDAIVVAGYVVVYAAHRRLADSLKGHSLQAQRYLEPLHLFFAGTLALQYAINRIASPANRAR